MAEQKRYIFLPQKKRRGVIVFDFFLFFFLTQFILPY